MQWTISQIPQQVSILLTDVCGHAAPGTLSVAYRTVYDAQQDLFNSPVSSFYVCSHLATLARLQGCFEVAVHLTIVAKIFTILLCLAVQVDDTSCITPCVDSLAQALVNNLTGRSGNPELAPLADRLLNHMLQRFPQLLWSAPVIRSLLVELQREEGALYLTGPAKPRMTLARVLRIRRKNKKMPLPAWTWLIRVWSHNAQILYDLSKLSKPFFGHQRLWMAGNDAAASETDRVVQMHVMQLACFACIALQYESLCTCCLVKPYGSESAVRLQMVQQGAVLAPDWTAAMFHELLDQETNPASAPALHHAAEIMSLHDAAKIQHCMAGMQHTISGQRALANYHALLTTINIYPSISS